MIKTTSINKFFKNQYDLVNKTNRMVGKAPISRESITDAEYDIFVDNAKDRLLEEIGELLEASTPKLHADALCDIFVTASSMYSLYFFEWIPGPGEDLLEDLIDSGYIPYDLDKDLLTQGLVIEILEASMKSIQSMVEYDCIGYLEGVVKDNRSKFPKSRTVCEQSVQYYLENGEDNLEVRKLIGEDGYWICRITDNKYMKPKPFYKELDLSIFDRQRSL